MQITFLLCLVPAIILDFGEEIRYYKCLPGTRESL